MSSIEERQADALRDLRRAAARISGRVTQRAYRQALPDGMPARTIAGLWPGGWREAVSRAGLQTAAFSDDQMLTLLAAAIADNDGLPLTARQINDHEHLPSAGLYVLRFGSLSAAHEAAGTSEDERTNAQRIIDDGLNLTLRLGRRPTWGDWAEARSRGEPLASEWQVWRCFGGRRGSWQMFHYHLLEAASERGITLPR